MSEPEDSERYLRLVNLASSDAIPTWTAQELADVWQHQLASPLVSCVQEVSPVHALRCEALCASANPQITTIEQLLHHPSPHTELFIHLARWLEQSINSKHELLPRELAAALLDIALILSRVRTGTCIVSIADKDLSDRARVVTTSAWLDDRTRQAMIKAADELARS